MKIVIPVPAVFVRCPNKNTCRHLERAKPNFLLTNLTNSLLSSSQETTLHKLA